LINIFKTCMAISHINCYLIDNLVDISLEIIHVTYLHRVKFKIG